MSSAHSPRRARLVGVAALIANVGTLALNVLTGSMLVILPIACIVILAVAVCVQTKAIRRREYLDRPRPDYAAIAAMEREVYGETFRHEGSIASMFLPGELHPLVTPEVSPGLFGSIAELRRERRTHPDTAEPATLEQYLAWLNGYIKRGGKPTHFYDYPFGRPGFCYAASSPLVVDSDREYGANSREIIVAKGVEVQRTNPAASFGGWGHSSLYFMDGYRAGGPGFVPVYSDPEFDFARRDDDDHRPNLRWERPSDPPTG